MIGTVAGIIFGGFLLLIPWAMAAQIRSLPALALLLVFLWGATLAILLFWVGPIHHELQLFEVWPVISLLPFVYSFTLGALAQAAVLAFCGPGSRTEAWVRAGSLALLFGLPVVLPIVLN